MAKSGCESALVVVALVWSTARGEDYSGAALPQYSAGGDYGIDSAVAFPPPVPEDYGHTPDAPARLDYKYEEELRVTADNIDTVTRRKPPRKMKKSRRRDEPEELLEKVEPITKNNGRRNRPRLREAPPRRRRLPRDRQHQLDYPQGYDVDRTGHDRRKAIDALDVARRDIANKIYRNPRDRIVPQRFLSDEIEHEQDEVSPDRKTKDMDGPFDAQSNILERGSEKLGGRVLSDLEGENERGGRIRPDVLEERERFGARLPPDLIERGNERFRGPPGLGKSGVREMGHVGRSETGLEGDEEEVQTSHARHKSKQYRDYGDYYDMRRVQNIKNKLPTILRRTTTRRSLEQEWSSTEREYSSTEGEWSASEPEWSPTVRPWRTSGREKSRPELEWSTSELRMTERQRDFRPEPEPETTTNDLLQLLMTARRASVKQLVPGLETALTNSHSISTTSSPTTTTANIKPLAQLSIAERSRLSILKKAQKKELVLISHSKKPTILLRVTNMPPTIVMVEPRATQDPWFRAQVSLGDSPHHIEKVKRLMRRKLVSNAKNMEDLTSNWNDTVCDYIDMSLLSDHAVSFRASKLLMAAIIVLIIVIH